MQANISVFQRMARRYWGMSLLRGVILIIFGLVTILWPHLTFFLFMLTFGIFALIEGIVLIGHAFTQRTVSAPAPAYTRPVEGAQPGEMGAESRERFSYGAQGTQPASQTGTGAAPVATHKSSRGVLVVEGILSIICGILALVLPGVVGAVALYVVAAWALFVGLGALMQMRVHGWVLGIIGVLGVILFLIVLFNPLRIIHATFWVIGVFALIVGIMLVVRAIQHNVATRATRPVEPSY